MNVSVTVDDRIVAQNLGEMSERLKTQLQVLGQATGQKYKNMLKKMLLGLIEQEMLDKD